MNASELYEIVKNVTREAWPFRRECFLVEGNHISLFNSPPCDGREPTRDIAEAVLLFESSMMRWLEDRGLVVTRCEHRGMYWVEIGTREIVKRPTRVEALAAACKEEGK